MGHVKVVINTFVVIINFITVGTSQPMINHIFTNKITMSNDQLPNDESIRIENNGAADRW